MPYPDFSLLEAWRYEVQIAWPIVVIALLASGWQPLAWGLRRMQARPLRLVVAVNLLNVVDAVMTTLAVRSGGAVEANPLVRFGGLPLKIVLVGRGFCTDGAPPRSCGQRPRSSGSPATTSAGSS